MIVADEPDGSLLLVCQPDHAATAAQIASAWRRPQAWDVPIWPRFIEAVERHDDGWIEAEVCPPLDEAGRPHDFKTIHTRDHVAVWLRGIDLAAEHDTYVALLVALHARWLYTHVEQETVEEMQIAQRFVDQITLGIDEFIGELRDGSPQERTAVSPSRLSDARRLLSFFDAFTLALAGGVEWIDEIGPLSFDDQVSSFSLTPGTADEIAIGPWPLSRGQLEISTRAKRLPQARFDNQDAFYELAASTESVELTWQLRPA